MRHTPKQAGFTLIELSIVLVIIGLIVGGVLVGQDLIKGAEIRAGISQLEKYDAAANTFRNKYGGLPGDIENPADFGFDAAYDTGLPNGNGRLNVNPADDPTTAFNNEPAAFFRHLSQAALIPDNIPQTLGFASGNIIDNGATGVLTDHVPVSKISGGALILPIGVSGLNYYAVMRGLGTDGAGIGWDTNTELRVIDSFQVDSKMDDGVANTGRVVAIIDLATIDAETDCHTAGVYNTAASANSTTCQLLVRTSF